MDQTVEERHIASQVPAASGVDMDGDDHLQRLLLKQEPFFKSVIRNIREAISPPKLPPLQVTSQPIPVKDIWGAYEGNRGKSLLTSVAIQIAVECPVDVRHCDD